MVKHPRSRLAVIAAWVLDSEPIVIYFGAIPGCAEAASTTAGAVVESAGEAWRAG